MAVQEIRGIESWRSDVGDEILRMQRRSFVRLVLGVAFVVACAAAVALYLRNLRDRADVPERLAAARGDTEGTESKDAGDEEPARILQRVETAALTLTLAGDREDETRACVQAFIDGTSVDWFVPSGS